MMSTARLFTLLSLYFTALVGLMLSGCTDLSKASQATPARSVKVEVFMLDLSGSSRGFERRCQEASTHLRPLVTNPRTRRLDVLVLGTGEDAKRIEPLTLVSWRTWQPVPEAFEGAGHDDTEAVTWLQRLEEQCQQKARPSTVSAVYQGAFRADEALRARCLALSQSGWRCDGPGLHIHSDMRENQNRTLVRRLKVLAHDSKVKVPMPTALQTKGIHVRVCGTAESDGDRSVLGANASPDTLRQAWKPILGPGAPEVFEPTCPVDVSEPASTL